MYCSNCGNHIDDRAAMCPHCGKQTKAIKQKRTNECAIAGFVLSLFFGLLGLIVSSVGLHRAKHEYNGDCKGLATAGVIFGVLRIVAYILMAVILWSIIAIIGEIFEQFFEQLGQALAGGGEEMFRNLAMMIM